jgi:hypothetical protein
MALFDDAATAQLVIGTTVFAYVMWKLCGLILQQTRFRQVYLVVAFCWGMTAMAMAAVDPTPRTNEQIHREARRALWPLCLCVRWCLGRPCKPTGLPAAAEISAP